MIVIKIKTWKDWKKDFLDWVQEPRRKTCKDFVDYMEALQNRVLYKIIADTCDKYGNMREGQIQDITIRTRFRRSSQTPSIGQGRFIHRRRRLHTRLRMMLGSS